MKRPNIKSWGRGFGMLFSRVIAPIGVLVIGFMAGMHIGSQKPPAPTISEIRGVVQATVTPLRTDVWALNAKLTPPKPEVLVTPVKTETVVPPKKKRLRAPETGFLGLYK